MKIWRSSGILLIITGILHSIVAVVMGREYYAAMTRDGLVNSVGEDVGRNMAVWFLVTGIFVIMLGQLVHSYIKKTNKPAPRSLGWWLLIISIVGGMIEPVSGFWLFLPQGLIIILANRRKWQETDYLF